MSQFTVLLPSAGRSSRFPGMRPKWMLVAPEGELMLARALHSVGRERAGRVVVAILREHEEQYRASAGIHRALGEDVDIVILDEVTRGPAHTAYEMIRRTGITGPVIIKDSDSWFSLPRTVEGNFVCVADLRKSLETRRVAAKSFVMINKENIVTMIHEKDVISNYINAGGYCWADAQQFCAYFEEVAGLAKDAEIFVSHVIARAITQGEVFMAIEVDDMIDNGTRDEWRLYQFAHRTFFIDIDGVVLKNHGQFFPPYWSDADEPIDANVAHLLELQESGGQFVFATARPETLRASLEATLSGLGLRWHALVMGCFHSQRVIVNDFAATNPYPSCLAVNIPRNSDRLADVLPLTPF
jgi:hypothetical protein